VRRAFLLALVAFFAIGAGWALAMPVNGTYDESEHIVRAYGVASGQIYAHRGGQWVPDSLLPGDAQCQWQRRLPVSCQRPAPADRRRSLVPTGAAGYSPLYYLPVGLPLLASPGYPGIVAGRLVSALLCALALAAAVAVAVWLGNRLLVGALVLAATPMVMNLAGSINPNGLEIAVALLLWTSLLALVRPAAPAPARVPLARGVVPPDPVRAGPPTRWLVVLATGAAIRLMTVRHLGPVLLGLVLVTAAVVARRGRVRALLRRRELRAAGAAVALSGLAALAWLVTSGVADVAAVPGRAHGYGALTTVRLLLVVRVPFYLRQVVGEFSYGETTLPEWAVVGWYVALAALAAPALLLATRRYRVAMLSLLGACLAVLVGLEAAFLHTAGWVAQARYVLPAALGVVLGGCFVWRWHAALGAAASRRLVRFAAVVAVPVHLWALAAVMTRFQIGAQSLMDPLRGSWVPAGGPLPALLTELLGVAALATLAWRTSRA